MVRKHWILLILSLAKAFLSLLFFFLVIYLIGFSRIFASIALSLILAIWFLVTLVYGFYEWAVWWLDLYVLTNKRVVNIEQKSLFARQVSETNLDKIQDVTFGIKGILATFFNYGTVKVATAGSETVINLEQVRSPERLQKIIFNTSTSYSKTKEKSLIEKE